MSFDPNFNIEFGELREYLVNIIAEEFVDQGHNLTGALLNSIQARVEVIGDDRKDLLIEHLKYGAYVNYGVTAARIPYTPGSGRKKSKYIEGLKEFVRLRRMTSGLESDITSVAFAIARKHKKEGMPTRGSRRYSRSGRRTGFVNYPTEQNQGEIDKKVIEAIDRAAVEKFDEMIYDLILD